MSQYMYTSLAPLPPVFSHADSPRSKATAKSSSTASSLAPATKHTGSNKTSPSAAPSSSAASTKTTTSAYSNSSSASSASTSSTATPILSPAAFFSKAHPSDSSRLPPTHRSKHHHYHQHHPSTRLQHIRTSSSSSASRSSHETSTTPTSAALSIPQAASPIDTRAPASPASPSRHKHKHHHSLQETRVAGDHGHGQPRSRAPARLRKESGSLSSYAKLALQQPQTPRSAGLTPSELKHVAMLDMDISGRHLTAAKAAGTLPFSRTDSLSSAAPSTASISARTMTSSDPTSSFDSARPFVLRNGRTYLSDSSLAYPLPVDLAELHRQSLRTLMLIQVFGGPLCTSEFDETPPNRVLEVACGSGFWSQMCHRHFAQKGHKNVDFTGIDIGPMGLTAGEADRDMKWQFVQHDIRQTPWPFADGEFDFVMVKDLSLVVTTPHSLQTVIEEYYRILRPGGTLEFWDSDHQIRMLRPHAAPSPEDGPVEANAALLGAYPISSKTPLSAPLNNFLVEYNSWVHRALEARNLSPVPCTLIGPSLLQECEDLKEVHSRRMAIPLSEVRWEREGVGGVVTKDGKSYIETGKGKAKSDAQKKTLTPAQLALRRTAMSTVVQQIQSLEPILREVSGKSQDEWDGWLGKMMNDLTNENGTSWGECLEVGAWWACRR